MTYQTGIVVKKYIPTQRKIVVLDQDAGLSVYVPDHEDICLGSIIEYRVNQQRTTTFIHALDKIKVPLLLAQQDILFLHHIFELCLYCLPLDSPAPEIFALIEQLYQHEATIFSSYFKKCFLVKFFVLAGMWPDNPAFQKPQLVQLVSGSIDFIVQQGLKLGFDRDVDEWLNSCLKTHPKITKFNTIHFLVESNVP